MPITVRHAFVSPVGSDGDDTHVQGPDWNAAHIVSDASGEYAPAEIGTAAQNTLSIQQALDRLAARGGGVLQLPPGVIYYTANPATQVAPDEGLAWLLTAAHSSILVRGAGKGITILKPASNRIEAFVQHGANNLQFEGITFDNSDNGCLQHFTGVNPPMPGTGTAGIGNNANAAVNQYTGAGLTITDCEFIETHTATLYYGNHLDNQELVGDLIVRGCRYDGCVVGILCTQPRTILFTESDFSNGVGSILADGSVAAGHGIYVSDRSGAYPDLITISDVMGKNNEDTNVRVRKGKVVTVTNCPHLDAMRGHNFENCNNLTVSNCAIRMKPRAEDPVPWGLVIVDCGFITVSNCVIDASGTGGIPLNILNGGSVNPWANRNGVIENITVIHDLAGASSDAHSWIAVVGQTDMTLRNITGFLTANVAQGRRLIELVTCTRVHIVRPSKRTAAAGNPAGSDYVVTIRADCTDCTVEWSPYDVDLVSLNTITSLSATTKITQIVGATSGEWLPVPTFATPGDFAPTVTTAEGVWLRIGNFVMLSCTLAFSCNAYTTAAGGFRITGIPFAAGVAGGLHRFAVALGTHTQINVTSDFLSAWIGYGSQEVTLRQSVNNSAGASLSAANFPAGRTGIVIDFTITYQAVPI